jgi:hypothetical protein
MASTQSTVPLQDIVDDAQTMSDLEPIFNVAQATSQPALRIANTVMNAICGVPFPHKWNELKLPVFYTASYMQDYAGINPDGTSITNLAWLERGTVININNTSIPKPYRKVEVGRQLPQATGTYFNSGTGCPLFLVNFFPNSTLYYGTWGQGNNGSPSFGNNPVPGSIYINPIGASVVAASWFSGQTTFTLTYIPGGLIPGSALVVSNAYPATYTNTFTVVSITGLNVLVSGPVVNPGIYEAGGTIGNPAVLTQPNNPITQIRDSNGNLLVLTIYGTEGIAPPLAPVNSPAGFTTSGTGATTVWTVVDPNGQGFRILPVPSQTGVVWQFNLVGQKKPIRFSSLSQTLDPLPDEFEPEFRQGFIAQAYRYSPEAKIRAKFKEEWALWLRSLEELRAKQDREQEENVFTPDRGIMGGGSSRRGAQWYGASWPFQNPR